MPPWLHDVFLGYGDPAGAHYRNLPEQLVEDVDFGDTLLDTVHVREVRVSFFSWSFGVGASSPYAPTYPDLLFIIFPDHPYPLLPAWSRLFPASPTLVPCTLPPTKYLHLHPCPLPHRPYRVRHPSIPLHLATPFP